MAINKYEKAKIEKAVRDKLMEKDFTFGEVEILEDQNHKLHFKFDQAAHTKYKNVRLMSHDSWVEETSIYTRARISLRFLFGQHQSPKIGLKIVSFKITIS